MIRIGARMAATCLLAVAALAASTAGAGMPPATAAAGLLPVEPSAADPVLVGAGDIARCHSKADAKTAALVAGIAGRVFAAGDLAYPSGSTTQFRNCYDPSWGAFRKRT